METLDVDKIEAVADRGYFKIEDIEACEAAGIAAYVPKPIRGPAVREGIFAKEEFRYGPDKDVFLCPADQVLSPRHYGKSRDNVKVDYTNRAACKVCNLRERCTRRFRRVSRLENEAVLDRMAARLAARPDILDRRRESVEHPFGTIKHWMNQGAFLTRRLDNVRGEFSLTALVLQHQKSCHHRRHSGFDSGRSGLKGLNLNFKSPESSSSSPRSAFSDVEIRSAGRSIPGVSETSNLWASEAF